MISRLHNEENKAMKIHEDVIPVKSVCRYHFDVVLRLSEVEISM